MRRAEASNNLFVLFSLLAAVGLALAGCGGRSSSPSSTSSTPSPTNNTQAIQVNLGPTNDYPNGVFTTVTICVPGSSTCQDIPNILVDTGSEGLRVLSSEVTLSLPVITDSNNSGLQECVVYADGSYNWGPVVGADIKMTGEKASSVPIQLIDSSNPTKFPVPSACVSGGGPDENSVATLGANGILGIGNFQQDCGSGCASSAIPGTYYLCPNSVCSPASVPVNFQVQNPVWMFPQDSNGVLISLPSIPDTGAPSASGSLIFGIGTQSDNALSSAKIYTTDSGGNIQTIYQNVSYSSFIDSGSNALFVLDAATLGIADCSDFAGFYCPGSTVSFMVTNSGLNGTSTPLTFSIANADALFAANNGQNSAFSNLGGDSGTGASTDYFDFGLPFFYGRSVFVGIENMPGPGGVVGPYLAY